MSYLRIFCAYVFIVLPYWGTSQKVLTTESGQKIILHQDGSWHRSDSVLDSLKRLQGYQEKDNTLNNNQATILQSFINNLRDKEALSRVIMENGYDDLGAEELNYTLAKKEKNKEMIQASKTGIKSLKALIKTAEKDHRYYAKQLKRAQKLYKQDTDDFDKKFQRLTKRIWNKKGWTIDAIKSQYDKPTERVTASTPAPSTVITSETAPSKSHNTKKNNIARAPQGRKPLTISTRTPVIASKNLSQAAIAYNDYDPDAGADRKQTYFENLFSYTHPKVRSYFKDDAYLVGKVSISKVDGDYFVVLEITMLSKDAANAYGKVKQHEKIRFTTIDGSRLYSVCIRDTEGQLEEYTGNTKYTIVSRIQKSSLRKLRKEYLDRIGIIWSSGSEEYPVYDIDVIKNQAELILN